MIHSTTLKVHAQPRLIMCRTLWCSCCNASSVTCREHLVVFICPKHTHIQSTLTETIIIIDRLVLLHVLDSFSAFLLPCSTSSVGSEGKGQRWEVMEMTHIWQSTHEGTKKDNRTFFKLVLHETSAIGGQLRLNVYPADGTLLIGCQPLVNTSLMEEMHAG